MNMNHIVKHVDEIKTHINAMERIIYSETTGRHDPCNTRSQFMESGRIERIARLTELATSLIYHKCPMDKLDNPKLYIFKFDDTGRSESVLDAITCFCRKSVEQIIDHDDEDHDNNIIAKVSEKAKECFEYSD